MDVERRQEASRSFRRTRAWVGGLRASSSSSWVTARSTRPCTLRPRETANAFSRPDNVAASFTARAGRPHHWYDICDFGGYGSLAMRIDTTVHIAELPAILR